MTEIIKATNLSKTYQSRGKAVTAVSNITFSVSEGELFGLFGPNGAGKSTIVRMLTTLLAPTGGTAVVNGFDVVRQEMQVRASIGLVTADERSFYGRLTARQNLQFYAAMQNVPRGQIAERIGEVLDIFGLTHKANAPTQSLSTGQKQRLNIARALIHNPPILFLDEPTKSMDVQTSDFVKALIRDELVNRQGKTVVFISHELYEMENFCDRVIILANGTVQAVGTPAELGALLPRRALFRLVVEGNPDALTQSWQVLDGVESVTEISRGATQTTFDIALADERVWFAVFAVIEGGNGRLESYHRADDESLRRIVAHFSGGELTAEYAEDAEKKEIKISALSAPSAVKKNMTAAKLVALITHNFRLAWAYKLNFVTRYLGMIISVLLFFFLDQLLQRSGSGQVEGGTYFTFLIIGGAFSKFLELSSHAFSANLREEMLQGTIEPLLVTATPVTLALLGPSSWMLLEGVLLVLLQLGVGTAVGADFSNANWGTAVLVLLVSLSSLISYGIFSAAFVIVFKRGDPMNWFINSVAYVFSGVFFPVELLPSWLRVISYALPFTYALRALRGALMRGQTIAAVGGDLLVLGGFTAILLPLSYFALRYAIRHLKQTGELAHY